ncbi:efflux RND transporter periplasmic adaptor subunit [Tuwongella immobilis]|uniref:Uncharacterized protein n=1 Tax=Tuwongella immobilis TaxID=692036 RepID=A0A6C2YS42_9BACT|nr:efflux RND transporter periplasmic adaptor subunit [Tuwongella immobilis]VIP03702.1 multidrug transporter : Efflux transporter, RND family, MFP subunit OS=Rhodopseudomonas palustris (strain BisA53) GN=RPE_1373 PE=4 SV=1: HlyD_2 [Tuwongella immobilis]VTS04772.1 multidrug transporter : Efflux transporter, RND family, MFP subunit OS=Rhodopseudomonas palustris (strain BisA53) GN=RPE_1373 PE=4 SV=1: HlyD_2 [Tuwongella immobilis]
MGVRATVLPLMTGIALLTVGCKPKPTQAESVQPVVVTQAERQPLTAPQSYTGVIRARYETDLGFRVGGKVTSRRVEIGQLVAPGQILATLDPEDYELAVRVAEADVAAAEAEAKVAAQEEARAKSLLQSKAISSSEYDSRLSLSEATRERREKAKRSLQLAKNRLEYCTLTADSAGVVCSLMLEAGQVVAEGQSLIRIARLEEKEAIVSIPEHRMNELPDQRAEISLWSGKGQRIPAKLRELSPTADPTTRTYQARFTLLESVPGIELGMTATVHLSSRIEETAVVVPATAILSRGTQPIVWQVDATQGKITPISVVVREYRQDRVVLAEGLRGGETIVRAGVQKLDAAQTVRIVEDRR